MRRSLIIVESMAKSLAMIHNLDDSYEIISVNGHFTELADQNCRDFDFPHDLVVFDKECVEQLFCAAAKADTIYLAFAPDRHGETIAYFLDQLFLNTKISIKRILVTEICRNAIVAALPRSKSVQTGPVHAYWANRVIDNYFRYRINGLLEKNGLPQTGCGRWEYVILNILCNQQLAGNQLPAAEPWQIQAVFHSPKVQPFVTVLQQVKGVSAKIPDEHYAKVFISDLKKQKYTVSIFSQQEVSVVPPPPFHTSSLLAEACQVLSFDSLETMRLAQELYEGITLGKGRIEGLITFFNTSSEMVSEQAITEVRELILMDFGKDYLTAQPRYVKSSKSNKSMAEAIRPISVIKTPRKVKRYLTDGQYRLYSLIWSRFVASQMVNALSRHTTVEVVAASERRYIFGNTESSFMFRGFLQAYPHSDSQSHLTGTPLPQELRIHGDIQLKDVILQSVDNNKKQLKEHDVIMFFHKYHFPYKSDSIHWLIDNNFVDKADQFLIPTQLGQKVSKICSEHASELANMEIQNRVEQEIRFIEQGEKDYHSMLKSAINMIQTTHSLLERSGKKDASAEACPLCGGALVTKKGKYGAFTACSRYPRCLFTRSPSLNIQCPVVGCSGEVVERRSQKGRIFYGCSFYPLCNFMSWKKPVNKQCPKCGNNHLIIYGQRGELNVYQCPNCNEKVNEETIAK